MKTIPMLLLVGLQPTSAGLATADPVEAIALTPEYPTLFSPASLHLAFHPDVELPAGSGAITIDFDGAATTFRVEIDTDSAILDLPPTEDRVAYTIPLPQGFPQTPGLYTIATTLIAPDSTYTLQSLDARWVSGNVIAAGNVYDIQVSRPTDPGGIGELTFVLTNAYQIVDVAIIIENHHLQADVTTEAAISSIGQPISRSIPLPPLPPGTYTYSIFFVDSRTDARDLYLQGQFTIDSVVAVPLFSFPTLLLFALLIVAIAYWGRHIPNE